MTGVGAPDGLSGSTDLAPVSAAELRPGANGDVTIMVGGLGTHTGPITLPKALFEYLQEPAQQETLQAILVAARAGVCNTGTGLSQALHLALAAQEQMKTDSAQHPDKATAAKTRAGTGGVVAGEAPPEEPTVGQPKNGGKITADPTEMVPSDSKTGGAPAGEAMANDGGAVKAATVPAGPPALEDDPVALEKEWNLIPASVRERAIMEIERCAREANGEVIVFTEEEISRLKNDPLTRAQIIRTYNSGELLALSPLAKQRLQKAVQDAKIAKQKDKQRPLWQYGELWLGIIGALVLIAVLAGVRRANTEAAEE